MTTSKQFSESSAYYDTIYRKKNYRSEAKFLHSSIQSLSPGTKTVLDVGCGTGRHIYELTRYGYEMTGTDISKEMLGRAIINCSGCTPRPVFIRKNAITMNLHRTYDCVLSLFHVTSYMTTNSDIEAFFLSLARHTKPGGLCFFDCWFGPGVINDPPTTKHQTYVGGRVVISRTKRVSVDYINNTVTVLHKGVITTPKGGPVSSYEETHILRYFFYPELDRLFEASGFSLLRWGTLKNNGLVSCNKSSWDAFFILRKR